LASLSPTFRAGDWRGRRLSSSPVKNAGRRGTPWLFGICKYSRLQGRCPQRAKSLQIRSPVDACRAA
jgi:hypothetical protein